MQNAERNRTTTNRIRAASRSVSLVRGTLICLTLLLGVPQAAFPQTSDPTYLPEGEIVSVEPAQLLSAEQLRELVAPIALYSDELLAIVLPASTYPLQIVAAARYREAAATDSTQEPDEDWDESIVALLNYPEALDFLNADLDWTWKLGQAVTEQQEALLAAVSAYREEAYAAGNLDSDENQVVAVEDDVVKITSADPEVIHVPYYDPEEVTVYQTERVYHYYPTAYPLYYYPYDYRYSYYDWGFWGISSAFILSWDSFHLRHYRHNQRFHPYYGRSYHRNHFRRTHRYVSAPAYKRRHEYRRNHYRDYDKHWRPDRRWAGARPQRNDGQRHIHTFRHTDTDRAQTERHIHRNPRQGALAAERRLNARNQRSSVHRDTHREINSVRQGNSRSAAHPARVERPGRARIERSGRADRSIRINHSTQANRPERAGRRDGEQHFQKRRQAQTRQQQPRRVMEQRHQRSREIQAQRPQRQIAQSQRQNHRQQRQRQQANPRRHDQPRATQRHQRAGRSENRRSHQGARLSLDR